jgi:hypothetical protein
MHEVAKSSGATAKSPVHGCIKKTLRKCNQVLELSQRVYGSWKTVYKKMKCQLHRPLQPIWHAGSDLNQRDAAPQYCMIVIAPKASWQKQKMHEGKAERNQA